MHFRDFAIDPRLLDAVRALGFETPTPIQEQAIPRVLEGADVMGLAQTGTGKTAAFALPVLHRLLANPGGGVRVLIITPTRELAMQVNEAIGTFARGTRIRSMTMFGGVGMQPQLDSLRRGVDIVVGCPGRIRDHLSRGTLSLSRVSTLILDEADQMFDMGFAPEIRRIVAQTPRERQTLLFSATMPDEIRELAQSVLTSPVTIKVGSAAPVATVSHALYPVPHHLKTQFLLALLERIDTESVLVFTRTKHRSSRLAEKLAREGHAATALQGGLSQSRRQSALAGFRSGKHKILVATDIAARGLDISRVSHVINFDMPDTVEAYTHRVGRTGRAEETGDAFTLVSADNEAAIRAVERTMQTRIERRRLEGFDYEIPAPDYPSSGRPGNRGPRRGGPPARGRSGTSRNRAPAASRA